jgi:hypothetical protein
MSKKFSSKYFLLAAALLLGSMGACQAQKHAGRAAAKGWTSLFDGKDLAGWHSYLKDTPGSAWKVSDGAIMLDHGAGGTGGDLVTNGEYQNFELEMDWKISEAGNSGIIFLVHEDPKYAHTYETGPEMQVLDNVKASDNKKANHLAGSLYDLISCDAATVHPAGQWNHVKIRLDKGSLTFWMNGKQVVHTQMWDDAWNKMIAASKFHQWPEFATFRKGHLALQDHGHTVWYRNIRIRQL